MKYSGVILAPLQKAIKSLKRALEQPVNEFTRDASIQRFEYTYELSWKTLKRYLAEETGVKEYNVKNLYREAGRQNLIDDVEAWFEYHVARNLTSHTYNEITALETYDTAKKFVMDADKLLHNLERVCGDSTS
jgi:nucleotidyltransferase substrate binding protein (TIGR01987 family)